MDTLHELAQSGAPPGTAVLAEEQTAGRGSRGREWASPPGGLWLSVLARPAADELLSLRAGLAIAAVLELAGLPERVCLKWPNDLMLGDRKTGGLLCEARWQGATLAWVAIGVGLNVTNPLPPTLARVATRLTEVAPGLTPAALADPVIAALRTIDARPSRLTPAELAAFAGRDWLRGRVIQAPVPGIADGIDAEGALRVRRADGRVAVLRAGTVAVAETSPGT
jgi:BirA family transcriptional regulator, biotin operon repressor / biotin---[acetyl-CoA-carboxylase] ligase